MKPGMKPRKQASFSICRREENEMKFDRKFRFSVIDSVMNIAVISVGLLLIGVIVSMPDVLWIMT